MDDAISLRRGIQRDDDKLSFIRDYDPKGVRFIEAHLEKPFEYLNVMAATNPLNVQLYSYTSIDHLINFEPLNDIRYINKFLEAVNVKLENPGKFFGLFESKEQRKARIFEKFPLPAAWLFYYLVDFIWKRIFPKVPVIHNVYYALTRGHNRVLSTPEVLGRLISCGFKILHYRKIGNKTYFCAEKIGKPEYDQHPTYGPLIKLDRVGFQGKMIEVYKFRTMHPYAEYLQEYIYEQNKLQEGGKFSKDIRITGWGKIMRKFWLDELPMLYNWLKRDLKLVGVRPLSRHYFTLYPKTVQFRRLQYKPGLIPPFYADLPKTFDEILASEKQYMMAYDKHPVLTDIRYFFKSLYNIIIKRARSA